MNACAVRILLALEETPDLRIDPFAKEFSHEADGPTFMIEDSFTVGQTSVFCCTHCGCLFIK